MKEKEGIKLAKEKEKSKKTRSINKELVHVAYIFVGIFLCLVGYLVYFNVVKAKDVINSPYNAGRQELMSNRITRGKILSNDGEVLARTDTDANGEETRVYPFQNLYSHVVGYSTKSKTGIELLENFNLLSSDVFFLEKLKNEFQDEKNSGNNVVTTLDHTLQTVASNALGDNQGAVVVMEPDTGKVLAMVSKPNFDPNEVATNWDSLQGTSSLLNRATQGVYPPGSTFKIVTALAYMRQHPDYENYSYQCTGSITVGDMTIECYHGEVHGEVNFAQSFAKSCNTSFANMGLSLDNGEFSKLATELMFNEDLPIPISYSKSNFPLEANASSGEQMHAAIGQGKTEVTPMHMAMLTAAIANGGNVMKPYFVERIENADGDLVKRYVPSAYKSIMTTAEAEKLMEMMEGVVLEGTASGLAGQSYTAAGKTGSAEYEEGTKNSHAWFVGYSNVEDPDIVVSVIVEGGGSGGQVAVPIARQIFDAYYN